MVRVVTKTGYGFTVFETHTEIWYIEDKGGSLTWELTPFNQKLVKDMVNIIINYLPEDYNE